MVLGDIGERVFDLIVPLTKEFCCFEGISKRVGDDDALGMDGEVIDFL